ncbi:MAG: hypothetical protein GY861_20025 [bacterium]|nr:hypothetical protein [bacterium]
MTEKSFEDNIVNMSAKQKLRAEREAKEKELKAVSLEIEEADPFPILNGLMVKPVAEQKTPGGILTQQSLKSDQDLAICEVLKVGPGFVNQVTGTKVTIEDISLGDFVWVLKWKLMPVIPNKNIWCTTHDAVNAVAHRKKPDNTSSSVNHVTPETDANDSTGINKQEIKK